MHKVAWWRLVEDCRPRRQPQVPQLTRAPLFFKESCFYGFDVAAKPIEIENLPSSASTPTPSPATASASITPWPLGHRDDPRPCTLAGARTSRVLLLFDGDAAGIRAAAERLKSFKQNLDVTICVLPEGQDPDDVLRDGGPSIPAQLDRAVDALEWLLSEFAKDADADGDADRFRRTEPFPSGVGQPWLPQHARLAQDFVLRRIGSILETEPDTVKSMMPEARAAAAVEDKPCAAPPQHNILQHQ